MSLVEEQMHQRTHVVIEFNKCAGGRKRVRCCACELPATARALFAVEEDVFLSFCNDDGTSIDTEGHSSLLSKGQVVHVSLWQAPSTISVVLVSATTASERYLGSIPTRTFAAVESLAETIFISDIVQLQSESGAPIKSDDDLQAQRDPLEIVVGSTSPQTTVCVDARLQQLVERGLLIQRAEPEHLLTEAASSQELLIDKLKTMCRVEPGEEFMVYRLNQALHTLDCRSIAGLPMFHATAARSGAQQVLPWTRWFRMITCNIVCAPYMRLNDEELQKQQVKMLVDTRRWRGLSALATELGRQLELSDKVQKITFKSTSAVASLPDVVDLYAEVNIPIFNSATSEYREVTVESEWTKEDFMKHLCSTLSIAPRKQIHLSIQRAPAESGSWSTFNSPIASSPQLHRTVSASFVEPLLSEIPVHAQLGPSDHLVLESCSVDCETCISDRMFRENAAPTSGFGTLWPQLHRLSCGHTVCLPDICGQAAQVAPFTESEVKQIPDMKAYRRPSASETKEDVDAKPSSDSRVVRKLIRIADRNGVLLDSLEFKDLPCPVTGCSGIVPHALLSKIPGFAQAEQQSLIDQAAWQFTRPCALEAEMMCEPWPVESMMSLGSCTHFFHLDCIAVKVKTEINEQTFRPLICPGCAAQGDGAMCHCVMCAQAGRIGPHKITEEEIKFLVQMGHLTQRELERWRAREALLSMEDFITQEGHVIVHCRNCPHVFSGNPIWPNYRCRECNHVMCTQCGEESHPDETCDDARLRVMRAQAVTLFGQANLPYQFCPQCSTPGGLPLECEHVTCDCGTEFCFVCGCYREPTIAHGDASFHRPSCRLYAQCCNDQCTRNGGGCKSDAFKPNECSQCRAAGAMCQRPQDPGDGDLCLVHDYDDLQRRKQETNIPAAAAAARRK